MPKELIINASIPLPADYMDETDLVSKVRPAIETFRSNLESALGEDGFKCYVEAREPPPPAPPPRQRKPRATRSDAGVPRTRPPVNGAAENIAG